MSTGFSSQGSSPTPPTRRPHPALSSPTLRQFLVSAAVVLAVSLTMYFVLFKRHEGQLAMLQSRVESSDRTTKDQIGALQSTRSNEVAALQQDLASIKSTFDASQQELALLRRQASERESAIAVSRAKTTQVRNQALRAREQLQKLRSDLVTWNTTYSPLMTNENGRRITASGTHLDLALKALRRDRPHDGQVTSWGNELDDLIEPLDRAFKEKDGEAVVTHEHANRIEEIAASIREALSNLESDRLVLDTVLQETRKLDPGQRTLMEAAETKRVAAAKVLSEAYVNAEQRALDEQSQILQKSAHEKVAKETEVRQQEIANEIRLLEEKRKQVEDQGNRDVELAQRERTRLVLLKDYQRDLPQIRAYLVAFTSDGLAYRERVGGTKGPMSLAFLRAEGALDQTRPGMERLMKLAWMSNDRNPGPIPPFTGAGKAWDITPKDAVEKAQSLLNKYGELMVEKGMLAP